MAATFAWPTDAIVRNGRLYDPSGEELPAEQPLHLFARWYGFSLTFPGCEVYGDADAKTR